MAGVSDRGRSEEGLKASLLRRPECARTGPRSVWGERGAGMPAGGEVLRQEPLGLEPGEEGRGGHGERGGGGGHGRRGHAEWATLFMRDAVIRGQYFAQKAH